MKRPSPAPFLAGWRMAARGAMVVAAVLVVGDVRAGAGEESSAQAVGITGAAGREDTGTSVFDETLIELAATGQWPQIVALSRLVRYYPVPEPPALLAWAESLAARHIPEVAGAEGGLSRQPEEWRDPLVEEISLPLYNFIAQLRVEFQSSGAEANEQNGARVARAVASLQELSPGVAPRWDDPDLLVSLPALVRSVMDHPSLQRAMADSFSDVARLRVAEALGRHDRGLLEFLAFQFAGTKAAQDAHQWLASQYLAEGRFAAASQHLKFALTGASSELADELRQQDEWAQRLYSQDRYAPRPTGGRSLDGAESLAGPGRADVAFEATRIDRLAGQVGNAPQRQMLSDLPPLDDADWVSRQLGYATDGPWLFVSNRFQVVAYHVDRRRSVWQSLAPEGQMQFAQKATFTATRPLVDTECLYVRLLYSPAGTLGCIDRLNGQFRWTYSPVADGEIVSDPFWLGKGLSVLQLARTEQQESVLRLVTLDPRTGYVWAERDLLRLRERWWLRRYAEVTQTESGVVAALGGVVVHLDGAGGIRWVRRQLLLPAQEAPGWVRQHFQPPWLDGGRLFLFQPGVPVLQCLQAETGELIWSRRISGVERLLGTAGTRLVLQTRHRLIALDKGTGETSWSHEADGIVKAATLHGPDQARFLQRQEEPGKRPAPLQLVTVGLDGKETYVNAVLEEWDGGDLSAGPLVPVGAGLWTFWAADADDPTREVAELRPVALGRMP